MTRRLGNLAKFFAGAWLVLLCALPFSAAHAANGAVDPGDADAPVAPHEQNLHDGAAAIPDASAAASTAQLLKSGVAAGAVKTQRFSILYTQHSEGSARELATRIESVRDDFQRVLGRDWPGVTEIRMGLGRTEMEALALPGGKPPAWAEALAYPGHNIVLLDALSLLKPEGEVTLRHELSHVALGQLSATWPRWFQEGMAMYLTGDRFSIAQYTAMFRAVTTQRLFLFDTLKDGWPNHPGDVEIAYAQSVIFVSWLQDRYGPEKFGELIDHVKDGSPFETSYALAFHSTLSVDEEAWRGTLASRYSWTPIVTGGTTFWGLMSVLMVFAWVRRRRDRATKMAELAAEDAAEDAIERLGRVMQTFPPAESGTGAPGDAAPPISHPDDSPPPRDEVPWDTWHGDEEPSESPERAAGDDEVPESASTPESAPEPGDERSESGEHPEDDDKEDDDAPANDKPRRILH